MALQFRLAPPYLVDQCGGAYKVRLSDDVRDIVAYIGLRSEGKFKPIGSGFFLYYGDSPASYLVTAAHVVNELGADDHFVIRLNDKAGNGIEQDIDNAEWHFHPDTTVDIAVLEYFPPEAARCFHWPGNAMATDLKIFEKDLGAGDLAYVVGVYRLLHGKDRNLPIVHTGHIALMPGDEPIPVLDWNSPRSDAVIHVNGYLIEVSTLPAISGAPVFVRRSLETTVGPEAPHRHGARPRRAGIEPSLDGWVHGTVWLLGVWQGAWMGSPTELLKELMMPDNADLSLSVPINMGVATPAIKLVQILEGKALKSKRDKAQERRDRLRAVSPQSDKVLSGNDILKKMLNTPPSPRGKKN